MRCALYARVSTSDKGQEVSNQLRELRKYAKRQGWTISGEFIDHESGAKPDRSEFRSLFLSASRREFDTVLVWALDRFTREGVAETFGHISRLTSYGVQFESFTEPHFRTSGPAGELMISIAAWIAEQERRRLSERVKAGLQRAKETGTSTGQPIGRPRRVFDRLKAQKMRKQGYSFQVIARKLGVGKTTVMRVCG